MTLRFGLELPQPPRVERVSYRIERYVILQHISVEMMDRAHQGFLQDMIAMRIQGLTATWTQERFLEVPRTWWDHTKLRWFPAWALKRWPVLYMTYDAMAILPHVPVPNRPGHTVEYAVWREQP